MPAVDCPGFLHGLTAVGALQKQLPICSARRSSFSGPASRRRSARRCRKASMPPALGLSGLSGLSRLFRQIPPIPPFTPRVHPARMHNHVRFVPYRAAPRSGSGRQKGDNRGIFPGPDLKGSAFPTSGAMLAMFRIVYISEGPSAVKDKKEAGPSWPCLS